MAISKARHHEFVRLHASLKSVESVVGKLHAGEAAVADRPVSELALPVLNRLFKGASDFLGAESLLNELVPLKDTPKHGDVLLLSGQLLAALEAFRVSHVQFRHARWYWLVLKDGSETEVEYVLVDPLAKAEAESS